MNRRALYISAIAMITVAGVALAAVNHNSTRSNVSQKPGLVLTAAGVKVGLQSNVLGHVDRTQADTNPDGVVVFKRVRVGDYTVTASPVETRAGKLDGLEVWGGLVTCGEGAIREGTMTCTVKVTFDGKATSGDLKIALLTVAPDAPR